MQNLVFTLNIVAPVFLIVAVGILLKQIKLIDQNFVSLSSKIVFTVSLPALIFVELSGLDLRNAFDIDSIGYVYVGTLLSFIIIWIITIPFIKDGKDRSVVIQGAFRGNYAIVGLALISNMFGNSGLGKASIILAFVLPLYNILAVVALTVPLRKERKLKIKDTIWEIIKNPLILAVFAALPFSYFNIPVTGVLEKTIRYLAELALPLALIGIGGSLNIKNIKEASALAFSSSIYKLIVVPLLFTYGAFLYGFRGSDLGILFILFSCPTAIASFIMAEAMGCNSKLAGNIVLITTLGSVISISIGLFILKSFKLL